MILLSLGGSSDSIQRRKTIGFVINLHLRVFFLYETLQFLFSFKCYCGCSIFIGMVYTRSNRSGSDCMPNFIVKQITKRIVDNSLWKLGKAIRKVLRDMATNRLHLVMFLIRTAFAVAQNSFSV